MDEKTEELDRIISIKRKTKDSESIKQILEEQIQKASDIALSIKIAQNWKECVGNRVDLKTAISYLNKKKLYVKTYNNSWAANLTSIKSEIIKKLNEKIAPNIVEDIIFHSAYPLKKKKNVEEKNKKEYQLNKEELSKIEETASKIENDKIKKEFVELMTKDMKYKLEKIDNGGSECPICKCIHEKKGLCIFCKNKFIENRY